MAAMEVVGPDLSGCFIYCQPTTGEQLSIDVGDDFHQLADGVHWHGRPIAEALKFKAL